MRIIQTILTMAVCAVCLFSCDRFLNPFNTDYGGEVGIGDKDISYIELGYPRDIGEYSNGKHKYDDLVMLTDSVRFSQIDYSGSQVDAGTLDRSNAIEYGWGEVEMVAVYKPSDAFIQTISVTSSDTTVVSVSKGTVPMGFKVKINGVGECDLRMRAVGNRTEDRIYHLKVTDKLTLKVYMDPFWMNNLTARIKYRCKSLPKGVNHMYLDIRDSVTVIGQARVMDQRKGESEYRTVSDTATFRLHQHRDKFKKDKRVLLRNVSSAVRKYNRDMKAESFIRVSGYGASGSGVRYVQQDGKWYKVEQSPYECKQIRLGLDVLSDSPYILFNVVMKKSQTPSSSDEDEEDTDDSDAENDEELQDYFVIEFLDEKK